MGVWPLECKGYLLRTRLLGQHSLNYRCPATSRVKLCLQIPLSAVVLNPEHKGGRAKLSVLFA